MLERHGLTRADADAYLWAIEPGGRRFAGAAALARIGRELGGAYLALGALWRLPGAGAAYRFGAARRSFLSRFWSERPPYG